MLLPIPSSELIKCYENFLDKHFFKKQKIPENI